MNYINKYQAFILHLCLLFLFDCANSCADVVAHQFKYATYPQNPANIAKDKQVDDKLHLFAGMGDQDDWGYGIAGAFLTVSNQIIIDVTTQGGFKTVDRNSFAGFMVDYKTPSGYLKRVAYDLKGLSDKRTDFIPSWGKGVQPDHVVQTDAENGRSLTIDLSREAPIGWNGQIWLSTMVENSGKGSSLEIRLSGITFQPTTDAPADITPFSSEGIKWKQIPIHKMNVIASNLTSPQRMALDHLSMAIPATLAASSTPQATLIIARFDHLSELTDSQRSEIHSLLSDPTGWKEQQGYVIRHYPDRKQIIATSLGDKGLVNAIAHLQRSLILMPEVAIALEKDVTVEKPETEERGIYINIGYGLSSGPITPDNWNEQEWESFIDQLVLARVTFWSFFLWTEIEHIYPDTTQTEWKSKNEHVFRMLRHAIDYSHRRGLRAVYLFTPTNIPSDMIQRHPEWATTIEYTNHAGICSRINDAYHMARIVHQYQMQYFDEADEYDIAFYDPGGCMCEECRKGSIQCRELIKQTRDLSEIRDRVNPSARFGFWTWAVWRYERIHHYSLRDCLLPEIAKALSGQTQNVVVIDSFHGDEGSTPFFEQAKELNFRTSNFVYQTNIEDGHVFLLPLLDFQQKWAQMAQSNRIDESFLMIMEVASKMPMAAFGAEYFWDADLRKETVVERYALQLTHQLDAASHLRDGFLWLDELTYKGATGNDDFNNVIHQMSASFDMAFELLPAEKRTQLQYLLTTARVYKLLAQAAQPRSSGDTQLFDKYKAEFIELTRQDPLFLHFSQNAAPLFFDRMVGWVSNGFRNGYF